VQGHQGENVSPSSGNCSKLRRFIARHLGIISTTMPTTFLIIICLAAFVILLNSSCRPTPTPHTPPPTIPTATSTPVVSPSPSNTPILPPTSTPTLLPPVTLEKPDDDVCIECGTELTLWWSYVRELLANEYYRLRVWERGQEPSVFYRKEKSLTLPTLTQGEFNWAVAIVRRKSTDMYEQMSEESQERHFHMLPPVPVILSISPTSMVKGTREQVVVSGENFTSPITLTVGALLQIIDADSNTITATVPATLAVGEYPVIVQDSNGRVVSSTVCFTVRKPTPSPTPLPPNITLISPVDNVHAGNRAEMTWEWPGSWEALGPDAVFAIRWGLVSEGEPHSQVWCTVIQRPGENWCPDKKWPVDFTDCDNLGERAMVWNVALALADWEARSYRQVLVQSELAYFRVQTNINNCPP